MLDLMFEDVSKEELENEVLIETIDHFSDMKEKLDMNSQWSIFDNGPLESDQMFLEDKQYKVKYKFIESMGATMDDVKWAEVTMFAPSGSVKDLWFAANSCIKQSGTHHSYIEGFELSDNGFELNLITGS